MLGSVCAADLNNVSDIENSNLIQDDNQLSYQNLEVSSNGSISDNYSYNSNIDYSNSGVIRSNYENNNVIELQQISDNGVISEAQSSLLNTTLSGHNTTLYFKNGTTYDVKLTDITGKALSNQTVSFLINGKLYNRTTGSDGVASMNINLAVGKYNITASYAGSSLYGGSSVTNLVEVLSTISANDVVKFYRNGTQYYAKFVDGNGNPLINTEVRFNINGVFYTRNTNNGGIANLSIALNPNKYILTAIHPNGEMSANNITVLSTINGSDITKYFRNGTQFYATFYDAMGNPLINETVRFNINGVIYEKRTNNKGTANLTISLYPGSYILTAYHPNGESHGYNINVLSTLIDNNNITMYYRDGTAFTIKVIDGQGKPLANTTVKFNINGVFYDKVTDENGIAKLGIRLYPNNYIITSSYNGLEVSNNIGVSSSNTTIIGKDAYIIINSINSNYTVTLVDIKGNPIENQTVYFKYNNKEVTATTDENGNATITISNLEKGDYNVTYGFNGVIGYYPSKSSSCLLYTSPSPRD